HDPEARPDEALHEYGMTLTPTEELAPADAVVLAVAHKPYQLQGWGLITDHLKGGKGLVVDVKGMLDPAQTPQGCGLWRL
ncbi:MAG: UDP binding domain-containing protein, partial [Deltaproteobacteria bacterium]|nr:UDP binding domain-containing protein [Deltaproteobacteria bacterium]